MKKRLLPAICVALILLYAFTRRQPLQRFHLNGYAQGTTYSIVYYAADSLISLKQTDSLLQRFDESVSLYLPGSLICKFNRSVKGIRVDQHFQRLVREAIKIHRETDGLVDPTVKPLVDAWGFGAIKASHTPDSNEVKKLVKNVGLKYISLKGNFLYKTRPNIQLDLNGIAQGYAVDLLANLLERQHIKSYLIELGGELRIKGTKPGNQPFTVGIEGISGFDAEPMRKVIEPPDGAITTSGNYRKQHEAGGKPISHLMNPLTGYPVNNEMISITVYAQDAVTADGFDNGFMAMGLKRTLAYLAKHKNMGAYIVYRKADGSIKDTTTMSFKSKRPI
ncbi:FAD:protein FMN transferase [Mucilaginibacter lacusdianchii]|uniref:FAD:protein FMN transferase n=1 Tax=Mucilaginibacter lacusdianchii TaxID=2684211 RepID=UPI00131B509D|nr:FAD:protein FMN transferase [Mucilaginibacter sp. JXJ CY 39]